MNIVNLIQGSPEWHAHRATRFNASEAPAMMGASKYKTRSDYLREKATGITENIDPAKQRLFDAGHAAEAAARPIVEAILGEELFPATVTEDVDGLPLSASFDGLTMLGDKAWECKLWNVTLADQIRAGQLEPHYYWQLEQQLLVSGAGSVYFTTSDGTPENTVGMWYEAVPGRREQLLAGWKQFAKDVETYQHVEHAERPAAQVSIELPALFVQARGAITDSNMVAYGEALKARLTEVRAIQLVTDQDFSNAKAAATLFRDQIKKLKLAKEAMLAQTVSIGEAARMIDAWSEDLRLTALQLEKDVEREDAAKKASIVAVARAKHAEHIKALNERIGGNWMPGTSPDFGAAMKNKRSYSSMQDAVDTALANAKIAADAVAATIETNRKQLTGEAHDWLFLFPDFAQVCTKAPEDFAALLFQRQQQDEQRKEAERERIRQEEAAKLAAAQSANDQRGKTEEATHAQPQATAAPQAPAASTPPPHDDAGFSAGDMADQAAKAFRDGQADGFAGASNVADESILDDFMRLLPISATEKAGIRGYITKWEKYRVARAMSMKVAA